MNQEKYYGTIVHWFNDMQRGSIMPDTLGQRIYADALSLAAGYFTPRSGDRVCFHIDTKQPQPAAINVEPVAQDYHDNEKTVITLNEWDFMQNAGFGTEADNPGQPIFILGQFLADQGRVPEVGDQFEGTLFQHANGQWMMSDVTLLQAAHKEDPFQTASSADDSATAEASEIHPPPPAPAAKKETAEEQPRFVDSIYKLYKAPEPASLDLLPTDQLLSGTVACWDDVKGYGFIQFGSKSQKVFFHISAFHYATSRPKVGQSVSFYCKKTVETERQKAAKVVLRGDEAYLFDDFPRDYNRPRLSKANMLPFITNCLIAAAFAAFLIMHSKILFGVYFVLSAISYFLYKFDKQVAQTRKKKANEYQGRIPEKNLHIADVLGGWPGALISRAVYRHKTSKASFIRIFWLTVAVNLAITYALLIHYADNPLLSILRN